MSSKLVLRRRTRRRSHLNLACVHCSMGTQHGSTAALTPGHESAVVIMPHCSCPSCIVNKHCKHCKYCKHSKPW